MRKTKFTVDQIIRILAESELPNNSISSVARKYGISQNTLYRWRQKYKGLSSSEAKRLKALEEENIRLKRLLAEKELEIQALTEIVKKNF
jgi:putative transposase